VFSQHHVCFSGVHEFRQLAQPASQSDEMSGVVLHPLPTCSQHHSFLASDHSFCQFAHPAMQSNIGGGGTMCIVVVELVENGGMQTQSTRANTEKDAVKQPTAKQHPPPDLGFWVTSNSPAP